MGHEAVWTALAVRLEGRVVVLEPLERRHEAGLRAAARDPRLWRWLANDGREPPGPPDGWFEATLAESAARREASWATVLLVSGAVVGSTRFLALRPEQRGLEIGWTWLAPSAWARARTSRPSSSSSPTFSRRSGASGSSSRPTPATSARGRP